MAYQPKSYKKFVATAATATLVASAIAPVAFADSSKFTDVSAKYKEAVDFVVSKGANGLSETQFGVDQNIKRVDAAVLLVNVLGLDIEAAPASGLVDVPQRAVKHINALKAAGITSGKTETTFDPDAQITRGELAIWIAKAFKLEGASTTEFKDVSNSYAPYVSALVAAGITSGTSETTFGTNANAKRGDYAIFLQRAAQETPAPADLAITNVSALSEDGRYVEVEFNKAITSIDKSQFSIKQTGSGARVGIEKATLSPDGKTVELVAYDAGDEVDEIKRGEQYTVSYTAEEKTISANFERPYYFADRDDARIVEVDADNKDFTLYTNKGTYTIEVPEGTEFDYEAALGMEVSVWFNGDRELVKYEINESSKVFFDAIEVTEAVDVNDGDGEIKLKTADKKYDLATDEDGDVDVVYFLNGADKDIEDLDDADYAKIILNDKGDVAYIYAYTFDDMTVVESVDGNIVEGLGDADVDLKDFVIVKDGKTIKVSDLQAGDAIYYNEKADNSLGEEGYAVVYNNKVTGEITSIYDDSFIIDGKKYKYETVSFIDEDGDLQAAPITKDDIEDFEDVEVTVFVDFKKNVQLLTGKLVESRSSVGSLLTDTPKVYEDAKDEVAIELEYVNEKGEEKLADVYFKALDSITVDGEKYKIQQKASENKDFIVKYVNGNTFTINKNNGTNAGGAEQEKVTLEDNTPIIVKVDDKGNITDLEIITTSTTLREEIEPGDSNARTVAGSKKLQKDTLIFVAEEGAKTDADDIKVYQFGDVKFDISENDAVVYYNEDGDVEFIVVEDEVATNTKDYIAVIDSISTTDRDVTRLVAFVNGKKETYTVDKVSADTDLLKKGMAVKIEVDEDNVVQDIFEAGDEKEFDTSYFRLNQTGAKDISSNKFTVGNTEYQKGTDFQIIDTSKKDLETQTSLNTLKDKKFHIILDGENSKYVSAIIILGDADEVDDDTRYEFNQGPSKAELRTVIADFAAVDADDYTTESYNAYKAAVDAAKVVEQNASATKAQIDNAVKAVKEAEGKLVEKEDNGIVITSVEALSDNVFTAVAGAVAYKVEGTIADASVTEVSITFTGDEDAPKTEKVAVSDKKYSLTITAEQLFGLYNNVEVSYGEGEDIKKQQQSFTITYK